MGFFADIVRDSRPRKSPAGQQQDVALPPAAAVAVAEPSIPAMVSQHAAAPRAVQTLADEFTPATPAATRARTERTTVAGGAQDRSHVSYGSDHGPYAAGDTRHAETQSPDFGTAPNGVVHHPDRQLIIDARADPGVAAAPRMTMDTAPQSGAKSPRRYADPHYSDASTEAERLSPSAHIGDLGLSRQAQAKREDAVRTVRSAVVAVPATEDAAKAAAKESSALPTRSPRGAKSTAPATSATPSTSHATVDARPQVHIGQIDIVIHAAPQPSPRSGPAQPRNLASRRYLRGL